MSTTPHEPQDPLNNQQPVDAGQQHYGTQGGKYGTAEYNPNQYTGTVERPSVLDRLLKLTLASAGLYVLNSVIGMIANSTTDFERSYREMGLSAEQAADAASAASGVGGPVGSIITLLISLALYYLVYSQLKKGKNWARILGTVLAALSIFLAAFSFMGVSVYGSWAIVLIALSVISAVLHIIWIVTAFKAPNNAYFAQSNRG